MNNEIHSFLALGDSYTIGEGVQLRDSFPFQTVSFLNAEGINFSPPEIIAQTGWTTDELAKGIEEANLTGQTFSWVTLLVGVNNQYRGRPLENFKLEFTSLLNAAINFAAGKKEHIVVLSIPDWGITPYALEMKANSLEVAKEIDLFNHAVEEISNEQKVLFINITSDYRKNGYLANMLVEDKLHPNKLIYMEWATRLKDVIQLRLQDCI